MPSRLRQSRAKSPRIKSKWKALRLRDDGTTYTANYDLVKVK